MRFQLRYEHHSHHIEQTAHPTRDKLIEQWRKCGNRKCWRDLRVFNQPIGIGNSDIAILHKVLLEKTPYIYIYLNVLKLCQPQQPKGRVRAQHKTLSIPTRHLVLLPSWVSITPSLRRRGPFVDQMGIAHMVFILWGRCQSPFIGENVWTEWRENGAQPCVRFKEYFNGISEYGVRQKRAEYVNNLEIK